LQSQLKAVQDWIKEKDFASAAEAVQGLQVLTALTEHQNDHEGWRKRVAELRSSCDVLSTTIKKKDAGAATKAGEDCGRLIGELAQAPMKNDKSVSAKFTPPSGSVKTWMQLMDGAYVDAKSAKTTKELALLAQAVAEEANAAAYLRSDARWRMDSIAVRDTALQVAKQAEAGDLPTAKKALKAIYNSCEVCHDRARKK
jgi:hypothetical protein